MVFPSGGLLAGRQPSTRARRRAALKFVVRCEAPPFLLRVRRGASRSRFPFRLQGVQQLTKFYCRQGGRGACGLGAVSAVHGMLSGSRYNVVGRFGSSFRKNPTPKNSGWAALKNGLDWAGWRCWCQHSRTPLRYFSTVVREFSSVSLRTHSKLLSALRTSLRSPLTSGARGTHCFRSAY